MPAFIHIRDVPSRYQRRLLACLPLVALCAWATAASAGEALVDDAAWRSVRLITAATRAEERTLDDGPQEDLDLAPRRFVVHESDPRSWRIALTVPTIAPVRRGTRAIVRLRLRAVHTDDDGPGRIQVLVQRNAAPWTKSLAQAIRVGADWQELNIAGIRRR